MVVALGLAVAAVLAVLVTLHPGPLPGEVATVGALQRLGEPVPTLAAALRATNGSEGNLVLAAPVVAWLLWRHRPVGFAVAAVVVGSILVVQPLTKAVVDRPRPTEAQVEVRADHASRSYPSGHSMSTTTVWGAGAVAARRRHRVGLAVVGVAVVALTGAASMVHGVHWPTDVVGGTALGAIAAVLIANRLDRLGVSPRAPEGSRTSPRWR